MKTDPLQVAIISLILNMLIREEATADRRPKRSNVENFNVLLSIYKMNPLKHSNVFKTFSNHILLPAPDEHRTALNFNINESHESREKENITNTKLKNGELINHATHNTGDRPISIDEGMPENFESGHFLGKLVSMNGMAFDSKENDDSDIFNDGLIQTNMTQSKKFNNDVNELENNPSRRNTEKIAEINRNFKFLGSVTNKVPYNVDETIVLK